MDERFEKLKQALHNAGAEHVSAFVGYDVDLTEDPDVIDARLDIAFSDKSDDELNQLYDRYLNERTVEKPNVGEKNPLRPVVAGVVDALMDDALANLADDPSSGYDRGYHDALIDVLDGLRMTIPAEYGDRFD